MCRIFGCFNTRATAAELDLVSGLQRHGGPDATGVARGPGWAVGTNRLAVTDPGGGDQPYTGAGGRVTVVFNGEIYNHDELRDRLRGRGHRFADRCDGNVVAPLYEEYGPAFAEHLDGMFAIAVLDHRAVPMLVLATDDVGMKPLYHHHDPVARALWFSSELPALLGFAGVPGDPSWLPGLDATLAGRTPFGEQTVYEGISVLPPATTLVCERGAAPRAVRRTPAPVGAAADADADAIATGLRDTLRTEVGRLLRADVPVAVVTSGGLDSGVVTALAAERGETHAFTIGYKGDWPFDERHHARAIAEHTGAVLHQVEIDPADLPALLDRTVAHLGQPNADPITVSTYALFAAIREQGFTVALTGDAADEVFGGYARMHQAGLDEAAGLDWSARYLDAVGVLPAADRARLYTGDYRTALGDHAGLPAAAVEQLRHGPGSVLERVTAFELEHRMPAYHLRRVDHLSMASSIEARLPFCQPSVVGVGRSLPDRLRIDGDRVKLSLYAAAAGLLPDSVLHRPKQPFTLPIAAMLRPGTPLWELAADVLAPAALRRGGQLDPRAVGRLFARQEAAADAVAAATLWALTVHELWRARAAGAAGTTAVAA